MADCTGSDLHMYLGPKANGCGERHTSARSHDAEVANGAVVHVRYEDCGRVSRINQKPPHRPGAKLHNTGRSLASCIKLQVQELWLETRRVAR